MQYSKSIVVASVASTLIFACAMGNTPAAKKQNAIKETSKALQQIYDDHPSAKTTVNKSLGNLVCTGSDSYHFAASTGGGVCTFKSGGKTEFYRFASLGVGAGIGFKKVAFVYAYSFCLRL